MAYEVALNFISHYCGGYIQKKTSFKDVFFVTATGFKPVTG